MINVQEGSVLEYYVNRTKELEERLERITCMIKNLPNGVYIPGQETNGFKNCQNMALEGIKRINNEYVIKPLSE